MPIRVTVWHEFRHEKTNPKVSAIYPDGMHEAIAGHLRGEIQQNREPGEDQQRVCGDPGSSHAQRELRRLDGR